MTTKNTLRELPKGKWVWVSKTLPKTVIHCDDILEIAAHLSTNKEGEER